jgi:hypothetical protein
MLSSRSRHSRPLLVRDAPIKLTRITLGQGADDGARREAFIQALVHDHPDLIPMEDIEPAFMPLVAVCRELETPAGYIDNLWVTPAGGLVIGECKLVRSPQARREVVAQALDYARALTGWSYETLAAQVSKARKDAATLWSLVSNDAQLDEAQFVDALERRLRAGRLMVLIIGDGIQEGAEGLTSYLQLHAGLHVGFALVDLSLWQTPNDGGLLVVPRVPMRTVLIERGVVRLESPSQVRIDPPDVEAALDASKSSAPVPRAHTLSEEDFYAEIEQRYPGRAGDLAAFVDSLAGFGVVPEFRRSLVLRWHLSADVVGSLGYIDTSGKAWFSDAWGTANKLGQYQAGEAYLNEVATAVGGTVRPYKQTQAIITGPSGRVVDVATLLDHQALWFAAIQRLNAAVAAAAAAAAIER